MLDQNLYIKSQHVINLNNIKRNILINTLIGVGIFIGKIRTNKGLQIQNNVITHHIESEEKFDIEDLIQIYKPELNIDNNVHNISILENDNIKEFRKERLKALFLLQCKNTRSLMSNPMFIENVLDLCQTLKFNNIIEIINSFGSYCSIGTIHFNFEEMMKNKYAVQIKEASKNNWFFNESFIKFLNVIEKQEYNFINNIYDLLQEKINNSILQKKNFI